MSRRRCKVGGIESVNQKNEAGGSVRRGRGCSVQAMGLGLRVVGRQYDQPRRSPSGLGFPNYCQRIALANRCPNGNIVGAEPKLRDRHYNEPSYIL